jgi:hypothetical protein
VSAKDTAVVDVVVETVARCRRRLQLVSAARRAAVAIPIAIVAVELIALRMFLAPVQLVMLTLGAVALASIAAAIPSVLRAPSMRTTAAAIDARLQLQDRTVTALQLVHEAPSQLGVSSESARSQLGAVNDPMAELVIRDAGARLSAISPRRAFPFEAPVHFGATLLFTVAATVVFLLIAGAPTGSWLAARAGSNGAAGAGAGRSGRSAKAGSNAQIVEGVAPSASVAQPRPSAPASTSRDDAPIGRESVRNGAETRALGRGANDTRALDSRASVPGRDPGNAAGTRDGGRGATGFAERTAPAAGGVNGAPTSNPRPASSRAAVATAPGNAAYRDDYRMASARAQTAIAQERVPARLRTYVRRYFVAIHP